MTATESPGAQDRGPGASLGGGALFGVAAAALLLAGLLLAAFVAGSTSFATDFDGGSHTGAGSNPAGLTLVLAVIGTLSGVGAVLRGPNRWRARSAALLLLVGGPVWLGTLALADYYH